jgi:hypothetical protein
VKGTAEERELIYATQARMRRTIIQMEKELRDMQDNANTTSEQFDRLTMVNSPSTYLREHKSPSSLYLPFQQLLQIFLLVADSRD